MISHPDGAASVNLDSLYWFITYCLDSYVLAGLCGILMRRVAMAKNWDINVPLFRIYNEWYYLLRGMLQRGNRWIFVKVDDIKVDVVVEFGAKGYVYSGRINDFVLSKSEGFDRIYLRDTIRPPLEKEITKTDSQDLIQNKPDTTSLGHQEAPLENAALLATVENLMNEKSEIVFSIDDPQQVSELSEQLSDYLEEDEAYFIPGDRFCLLFSEIKNLNLGYVIQVEGA